ncbi:response regulator, partial [candidate division KSB3 bacterium]|nr:response regulator [candidate division KSB3 bacterium]MBD3327235.1 response regulator [candidate division KSB3 bacterium]
FRVLIAQSGQSAIEQIAYDRPDIILLDILMPEMNGFETCRRLKQEETTQDIPVIFMTALSEPEHVVRGFEVGGVDYITKPFQQEEVLARIMTHLTLRRQQRELYAFFSIIAHDMHHAIVPMIGLSNLLSDDRFNGQNIPQVAQKMDSYVKQAHQLLENLVYWAGLHTHKIDMHREVFDLHNILLEIRGMLRAQARQKQIDLLDLVEPNTWVYADPKMTSTILRNLLTNSLKFTPHEGKLTISATKQGHYIESCVRDTGVGMSEDQLQKLFRIDQKFSTLGTDGESGSGLGLILCKELIEKQEGTIRIESTVDKGTQVIFTLPHKAATPDVEHT